MPEFLVSQSTFERLQQHARPLVDTIDMVVNRALDALENSETIVSDDSSSSHYGRLIDPLNLPNLTHTKVLNAVLGEELIAKPNWNSLVGQILTRAMMEISEIDELQKFCPVNIAQGRAQQNGFRYIPEFDVSFQGMPANEACRALVVIADKLELKCEIIFMWRHKSDAENPGERACLKLPITSYGKKVNFDDDGSNSFQPFPHRGGVVTNELIDDLRNQVGD